MALLVTSKHTIQLAIDKAGHDLSKQGYIFSKTKTRTVTLPTKPVQKADNNHDNHFMLNNRNPPRHPIKNPDNFSPMLCIQPVWR